MSQRRDLSDGDAHVLPEIPVEPRNERQAALRNSLLDLNKPMVIAAGEAGAGKTFWACEVAAALLMSGQVR